MNNPEHYSSSHLHRASYRMQSILRQKPARAEGQSWLIVYLDVITLLLAMFILLVNQPQQEFLVEDPKILQDRLQPEKVEAQQTTFTDAEDEKLAQSPVHSPEQQQNIAEEIRKQLETIQGDDLVIQVDPGTIKLQLPESILFETGKSDLLDGADLLLETVAPIILQYDYPVSVEGHTDNVPIASAQFPSNWELSSARASGVIRKLVELGVPYIRLKAIGFADTNPIDSNETVDGRRNNRRVNIIIHAQ
jgi:chemotaxis protein MotB